MQQRVSLKTKRLALYQPFESVCRAPSSIGIGPNALMIIVPRTAFAFCRQVKPIICERSPRQYSIMRIPHRRPWCGRRAMLRSAG
ncbi:hypothetical protein EFV37_33420 [Mesorhizobium loti]|uniref:Uncharacterized protein n=2 Tax=Mesorhizobium TaxID=68287 RepID=A0A1A5IGL7_RHILI|nr:hypothetical protein A9174_32695 [Mesorhizobium loti NZP2037]OBP78210.1 hypothetical protein BAE42_29040 [Mesorhizobium loti]QKC66549.1 hypothetical protein EB229_33415 [Mesorhizobium jarvisii]QKC79346.1 hypothetical protein EB233_31070 [Mesorhizobium erdmanii]OBP80004.1 hypothetical protein BAE39_27175 [Mesorhizobium loti]